MSAPAIGRAAYESDVAARPTYQDGTPRKTWDQLDNVARYSWEREPRALPLYPTVSREEYLARRWYDLGAAYHPFREAYYGANQDGMRHAYIAGITARLFGVDLSSVC